MISPCKIRVVAAIIFVSIPLIVGFFAKWRKKHDFFSVDSGIWIWGTLMVVIGFTAAVLIIETAIYIDPITGVMYELPQPYLLPGLYRVIKDLGALIGIILDLVV